MEVVNGPTVDAAGSPMYQVTLASGAIVTSPAGFAPDAAFVELPAIVAISGQVLSAPKMAREVSPEFDAFESFARRLVAVPKAEIAELSERERRAKAILDDPEISARVAESARRHATGAMGEPDSPESLAARIERARHSD